MSQPGRQHPSITGADPALAGILAKTGTAQGGAVVQRVRAAPVTINPTISPPSPIAIVVKKTYTNPRRVQITLRASGRVRQPATLTRIMTPLSGNIRLFDALQGGNEITFTQSQTNATESERVIPANELNAGKHLFAESDSPCSDLDDYRLRLTLAPGPTAGPPFEVAVVAVSLTLDISTPRTAPGAVLTPLPQPPDPRPAPGTATDKWFGGLELNTQDPGNNQQRAELRASVSPGVFSGVLVLRQVAVTGDNITGPDSKVDVFTDEFPGPRQTPPAAEVPQVLPLEFNSSTAAFPGRQFFAQGKVGSTALRDTGFQLGIKDIENDGDRVALTVRVAPVLTFDSPIVVVKKPHTTPARRVVTVRASSAFGRTGTLTRSPGGPAIHVFDPAGQEILDLAAGHVFTAAELSAGVQLSVESTVPSGAANDVQLTLTLAPSAAVPVPLGGPATIRMTAVELTLDVALSRTSPGVTPPLLSANDKINTGRFVQARDPGFSHERAMIILRPPNPSISLTVVLEATSTRVPPPASAQVQAFGIEAPAAGQFPQPSPVTFPSPLLTITPGGMQLFVEGSPPASTAVRDTGFRYGIQGLENEADRVAMTTVQFDAAENDVAATPLLTAVRFGLWDNAYDAAGNNVRNDFIDNDRRRFHFRVTDPAAGSPIQISWKTVAADGTTNDDAPASQLLTLPAVAGSPGHFVSRGVLLVSDDTDAAQTTQSGLNPPLVPEPRARGASDHRLRRAAIDGFIRALFQPSLGQFHRLVLPLFNRAVPFDTTSAAGVAAGSRIVTPAAMSDTVLGVRWTIRVGSRLTIDTGASQEEVVVTAVTPATFTATFAQAHAAGFRIAGTVDERRRLRLRVIRYTQAGVPSATDAYIAAQFANANRRWNTVGLQIDPQPTVNRAAPAGALLPIPGPPAETVFAGGGDSAQEQAALNDLIPITPDNTLTVVFVPLDTHGFANAYATVFPRATVALGNRSFIFIDENINLEDFTLAHELHHVLFNRGDVAVGRRFFTFNTTFAPDVAAAAGIALPDVRLNRRLHTVNSADPNNDNPNDNTANWFRRRRTARFPIGTPPLSAAAATTGNTLVNDFT